jgi:hypothetical protein
VRFIRAVASEPRTPGTAKVVAEVTPAVVPDRYACPFAFTGRIESVAVDLLEDR